eukprot:GHRR01011389.1.p1 GENE.GHRR01011389.1~~GHRR01011389.1.p1  ORF type:complete len:173 (+),score=92.41 GHRR01011389.1:70-519(+)
MSQQQQQQLGPLAAKLKAASTAAAAAGATGSSMYSAQLTGSTTYEGYRSVSTSKNNFTNSNSSPRGTFSSKIFRSGSAYSMHGANSRQTAISLVAAGGDIGGNDQILIRVLCHRADHAASKYLKDQFKVPKARDATISEALGRFTRFKR